MKLRSAKTLLTVTGRKRRAEAAVLLAVCMAFGYMFYFFQGSAAANELTLEPLAESQPDYSKFNHSEPQHTRLPCLVCHKREVGLFTPRRPGHTPCAACHVQQFADNTSPMCTICHTATGVKPFPPLRSFNAMFNHGRHIQQTGCATCHKPTRRGVALSIPSGATAHRSCFQCHAPQTDIGGRNIGSCSTCHQPGRLVRTTENAKAYGVNFSHQEHLRRGGINCASCHSVLAGSVRGRQVTSPAASMHFAPAGKASCAVCHNSKRAFGISDFANCRRCHEGKTFKF